ncbi:Hsp20/alpha crystallin family protein [Pedobacter psychroterrae]|uniref:Hsp20/alpha crystallin family protein n=1 Tax=Pedobacter psychroterrae TaxID=2530453 RepID=A0A4R0NPA3_9SPHI|nr:Hsp20/alpha crystallin family protein [Pedobacter psychroterrae]TCD01523.1 Hsp20/alpha crystallin family protein [Pedobacter psychroterrae]
MTNSTKTNTLPKIASMTDNFWDTEALTSAGEPKYAVNIQDKAGRYKLEVSAPGFKKNDFRITTDNGVLTVTAESNRAENDQKENYIRKEFSHASFTGSFLLPENVLEDHISAKYHNGLFTVNLKKSEKGVLLKKRQIKIH